MCPLDEQLKENDPDASCSELQTIKDNWCSLYKEVQRNRVYDKLILLVGIVSLVVNVIWKT